MKRRKFVKIGLGATLLGPAAMASGGRLYGEPGVGDVKGERLNLALDRLSIPEELWEEISKISGFACKLFSDTHLADSFVKRDHAILAAFGFEENDALFDSKEFRLVSAAVDKDVVLASKSGNFSELLETLVSKSLLSIGSTSILERKLDAIIAEKLEGLSQEPKLLPPGDFNDAIRNLEKVASLPSTGARTYAVPIPVNVIAGINIVVAINFAVLIAIYAWTQGPSPRVNGRIEPFSVGKFIGLDPGLLDSYETALQVAFLTGNENLISDAFEHLIDVEANVIASSIKRVMYVPDGGQEQYNIKEVVASELRRVYRL